MGACRLKPAVLAALCALALGLTGCVRYYKTADVRARLVLHNPVTVGHRGNEGL